MRKLAVIYWSGSGNTETMAEAIAESVKGAEVEVTCVHVDLATKDMVAESDLVALGCPAMGSDQLEDSTMEPFVDDLADLDWSNKKLALFGSYDWGEGDWMRDWEDRMKEFGAHLVKEGLTVNLDPSDDDLEECRALGKALLA